MRRFQEAAAAESHNLRAIIVANANADEEEEVGATKRKISDDDDAQL